MNAVTTVLLAPDKFKGSLTALEVAEALRRGLLAARSDLVVRVAPVADGGDGTLDAALAAGYTRVPVTASGPTGEPVETAYACHGDTAVVEMADVSGLSRLPGGVAAPLDATSRGTGEVMAQAIAAGCRRLVVGIGGSACTDGGAGMVQALGARLLDEAGRELPPGGASLARLARVDLGAMVPLDGVEIVVACDVDNPLTGPRGAAAVYGPQKGASPDDVATLDTALAHWADVVSSATGRDLRESPGAGAAGGVGYAAIAVLGARLQPGIDLVLDLVSFDELVRGIDWVVVGEGSLDEQTLHGKAPVGVAARARRENARVLAVSGRCSVRPDQLASVGIEEAFALTDDEPDPDVCMREAPRLLERLGERLAARIA
ncbi:MAG TPA: glycerate kinase [Nocardioidaceae bacterium]